MGPNEACETCESCGVAMHVRQDRKAAAKLVRDLANEPETRKKYARVICSLRRGTFFMRDAHSGICMGSVPAPF